jgi:hypothetical protein
MATTTRTTSGPLGFPGVLASIVRDHVNEAKQRSAEAGTSRITEAGELALLRDAAALDAMHGGE